jgi:Tfp pilus assembly protein PilF
MSAEAHGGLAESYVMLGYHGYLPASSSFPKGKAAALRALELDSARGDAWSALGVALQAERRWTEADSAFREAIRRTPDYATAHQWYALLLMILGRGPEAVAHGRRAAELDPLSIQVNNTYGITLSNAGMLDSALAVYERIVTHEPDTAWVRENPWVLANFGKVAARAGRPEQGVALLHRALVAVPGHPRVIRDLVQVHVRQEDYERARETFAMVDTAHVQHLIYAALTHAELGDTDAAFDAFEHVQEWGLPSLLSVSGLGSMRSIREDPRYPALRARIGLPDPPPEPMRR